MMNLSDEDLEKIKLVDQMFNSLTASEVKELLGHDLVISKLRGDPKRIGILEGLTLDNTTQSATIQRMEREIYELEGTTAQFRSDLVILIKYMNEKFQNYSPHQGDFNLMKGRYGIY